MRARYWHAVPLLAAVSGLPLPGAPQSDEPAAVSYADFSSTRDLRLVGDAERVGTRLRLTPAEENRRGAAWLTRKQPVAAGFDATFQFQLTGQGGLGEGADGFALVLQNNGPKALAGKGSSGGFALGDGLGDRRRPGIPNSIAVFFDTFKNDDGQDPSNNYIAVCTNGQVREMRWPPPRLGVTRRLRVWLKDGRVHTARVTYQPPVVSVYLDDLERPVLTAAVDLASVVDGDGYAYVGFTASTGAGYENHDILNWSLTQVQSDLSMVSSDISFHMDGCLEGRNLCTPERATIEEKAPGQYHVVLPAHLEWGASIPNPGGRRIVVSDARGVVCWDLEARGSEGCGGPNGTGKGDGRAAGLLAPDGPAGVLVAKTEKGRTYFSVNERSGSAFKDNQGLFEFDVRIE